MSMRLYAKKTPLNPITVIVAQSALTSIHSNSFGLSFLCSALNYFPLSIDFEKGYVTFTTKYLYISLTLYNNEVIQNRTTQEIKMFCILRISNKYGTHQPALRPRGGL
jgi:hypothetical protein